MTKRRSSIKGRGSEILLGPPEPVEVEPLASDPEFADLESLEESEGEPSSPPSPEPAAAFEDDELESALRAEALDGEPDPEVEADSTALEEGPPPTPEMEQAFFEEAVAAEVPPEPEAETPIPTLEETMEEEELSEEMAIHEPPPAEVADVSGDVLPPKPAPKTFGLSEMEPIATRDIQEPEEKVERIELPKRDLTEEEEQELLARLGGARIQQLDEEITKIYDQVLSKVGENESIATECYNLLLKARDIVLHRQAARIPQAEYYVEQVRARLKRATESESGAKKYAWWIAGWGLFWFVAYIAVLILYNFDWFRGAITPSTSNPTPVDMEVFIPAMIWGGIGGVAAVFYSLFKHVGRRDFDSQYNLSYVGKPFLGVILGATVYMIIRLMIMTLGIFPAGLAQGDEALNAPTVAPWIIYLLAWACGFKENRIFDLVDRVMKQIFSGSEEEEPAEPAAPTG